VSAGDTYKKNGQRANRNMCLIARGSTNYEIDKVLTEALRLLTLHDVI
jgi:hypothetical protein